MYRTVLNSKIHRATVTHADLDYVGSITLDRELMDLVGLVANEQVQVLDITNGNRLTTYVIEGERYSGVVGINGAAAHLVQAGDLVIICSYVQVNDEELASHKPKIALVDSKNRLKELLSEEEALSKI